MLRDKVRKYTEYDQQFGTQREYYHFNCAQAILHGANDYYKIGLTSNALKMIAPFGGGMYVGDTCGMLTGGLAAIGALFAEDMPTQNLKLKAVSCYWIEQFESEFQHIKCSTIRDMHLTQHIRCSNLILRAADILQKVIEKYQE